jgi:hypothetical protein
MIRSFGLMYLHYYPSEYMFVAGQLLMGLAFIHLLWVYFFVTGSLVRPKKELASELDEPSSTAGFLMADLVITTATGVAITGFVILIFGFLGILNAYAFMLWLATLGLLFKVLKSENVFAADFWRRRFKLIRRAWNLPALIIYCAFLLISVPAILPPTLWDSTMYHLAYAVAWANAEQIYVDEFVRFPYYSNNFVLLYSLLFALKLELVCHWLTWLCGLLTGLGVYSLIVRSTARSSGSVGVGQAVPLTAVVLPVALAFSPVFLRYVDTGYVDIPIGLFLLVPILCAYLSLQTDGRKYELEFVLTAAFCVGMKITNICFLPLFIGSLVLVTIKKGQRPLSRLLLLVALLVAFSSPWYVRNLIATGDPLSPALNVLFNRPDPIWTPTDVANARADFTTAKDPASLLRLPIDLFWNTLSVNFREPGTNATVVLLYVPFIMVALLLVPGIRRWFGVPFVYLNVALIYVLASWIGISTFARYFLHVFPLYTAYVGVWLNKLLPTWIVNPIGSRRRAIMSWCVTAVLGLILLVPNPPSRGYYRRLIQEDYRQLPRRFRSYQQFLRRNLQGYASIQYLMDNSESRNNQSPKVLVVGFENLAYYFRKNNLVSFGDWFGPGRHADLRESIDNGSLSDYLARFNVGAVLVNLAGNRMDQATYQKFITQLEQNHFVLQPTQEPLTVIYIKPK